MPSIGLVDRRPIGGVRAVAACQGSAPARLQVVCFSGGLGEPGECVLVCHGHLGLDSQVVVGDPLDEVGALEAVDGVAQVGVPAEGFVVSGPQADSKSDGDDADRDRSAGRSKPSAQVPGYSTVAGPRIGLQPSSR